MALNVNLLDTLNFDSDAAEHLLDEVYDDCPTLSGYDKTNSRSIPIVVDETDQDAIKTLVRIKLPEVDPFRYANEGVKPSKGTYEPRMISLATVTSFWDCDQSIIKKNPRRGARFMEAEAIGTMRAHTLAMEQQFFYGNKKDAGAYEKGFQGLTDFCDPAMVTDVNGAAADNLASVWFVWWDMLGVSWVYGQEGHVGLSEPELTTVIDEKGGKFKAYEQSMEFYPGLKVLNSKACGRIANIPTKSIETGVPKAGIITDMMIRLHLAKFPKVCKPNVIYMPESVNLLLAASRTASITNENGDKLFEGTQPPPPKDFDGIPIVYTDQLSLKEPKWKAPAKA